MSPPIDELQQWNGKMIEDFRANGGKRLDARACRRDVQDAAGHADPRTTRRYDRARHLLDRHPTYMLAGLVKKKGIVQPGNPK